MKLTAKAMDSPMGLRVTFDAAPVEKFHITSKLPNTEDPYRIDVNITMPKDRTELWLEGAIAAFRRIQHGKRWSIRLDYPNVMRFFSLDQLYRIDKRNADFSMHLYRVPQEEMDAMNKPEISVVSKYQFSKMYSTRKRKESPHKEEIP